MMLVVTLIDHGSSQLDVRIPWESAAMSWMDISFLMGTTLWSCESLSYNPCPFIHKKYRDQFGVIVGLAVGASEGLSGV